jgi:Thioredoxin domain
MRILACPAITRPVDRELLVCVRVNNGAPVTLQEVEDLRAIVGYGVMPTPGVVINGKVLHAGAMTSLDKIEQWLSG